MRKLSYAQAIREAFAQLLKNDPRVFVIGQGLWSPWYVGTSMKDIDKEFGRDRVIDCPVSENATTGAGIGAALAGMRPIVVHPRMDFMLLAVDQIVNQASNWSYMFGGQIGVPVVLRSIINRGGEQGAQHSQAVQAFFAHIPGLKVVMPATAYDAKGMLISAVRDGNPVIYIDDRWLYSVEDDVPEEMYEVPLGKAAVRRPGSDVTLVTNSYMLVECLKAAESLAGHGISAEVLDLRSIKPLDEAAIVESVRKTGRAVVVDGAWRMCGVASEVSAVIAEKAFDHLKAPVIRVTLPEAPAPTSKALEQEYYIKAADIAASVQTLIRVHA
jgi:pyruvate dehydrogenase E1 component beta subunit